MISTKTNRKEMGAAGFEPAAAWSEAKYSVQAELSARIRTNPTCNNKSVGRRSPSRPITDDRSGHIGTIAVESAFFIR